jgi:hypothetical protein
MMDPAPLKPGSRFGLAESSSLWMHKIHIAMENPPRKNMDTCPILLK